jgi:hypothetical protein
MVDVPNRAHVHVRLRTLEFAFCHLRAPAASEELGLQ